jgi:hypothetical protein
VVQAIRRGDPTTPILLDGGFYASPFGLSRLEPVPDDAVLYAFHYYEAWDYLTFRANDGRFSFPDRMPEGWTPFTITVDLERVAVWARTHAVDPRRIVAAEFGVDRRTEGAVGYLDHLLIGLEQRGWHWAFYAFRGDGSWGGLDYELGAAPFDHVYWASVAQGIDPERLKRRGPNPLWRVISRRLRGSAADPEAANHP